MEDQSLRYPAFFWAKRRVRVPPSPHPLGDPHRTHVTLGRGYKSARAVTWYLSQIISCGAKLCRCVTKMVDPRMRVEGGGLRTLINPVNVHGLENINVNRPEERTMLEDHPILPSTQRNIHHKYLLRCRRVRLTHNLVDGFINSYCFIIQNEENCLNIGRRQKQVLGQMLVRQFLPWIRSNLMGCMDESQWPLQMDLFKVLDDLLFCFFFCFFFCFGNKVFLIDSKQ